jgi:hypothetical protein
VCANQNTPNYDFPAIPDCGHPLVPSSVRRLDDLLNRRISQARTSAALNDALIEKLRCKRRLVRLPDTQIEIEAARAAASLEARR